MKRFDCLTHSLTLLCLVACLTQHSVCQGQNPAQVSPVDRVQRRYQSQGAPVSVTAEIVSTNPQVADPIGYRIMVDAPVGTTVVLPPVVATSNAELTGAVPLEQPFADFLLTGVQISRDVPIDGKTNWRRTQLTLQLESLKSGVCRVPALEVAYRLSEAGSQVIDTGAAGNQEAEEKADAEKYVAQGTINLPELGIEVGSVLGANDTPDNFRDIKAAVATPADEAESTISLWIWFTGAAIVFALAALGCCWWRRNTNPKADRWGLQRIGELERAFGDERIAVVDVYSTLSAVLRDYLQSARQTPAKALSTEEFLDVLKRAHFDAEVIAGARTILTQSDASKFAPSVVLSIADGLSPFDQARAVVEESMRLLAESRQKASRTGRAAVNPLPDLARKAEA